MKIPICILVTGTFSGFGCPLRLVPKDGEIEIAETHLTRIHIICFDLATRASGVTPAVWSLVVAELDHGYRRIGVSLEVGGLADQLFHHLIDCSGCLGWIDG